MTDKERRHIASILSKSIESLDDLDKAIEAVQRAMEDMILKIDDARDNRHLLCVLGDPDQLLGAFSEYTVTCKETYKTILESGGTLKPGLKVHAE